MLRRIAIILGYFILSCLVVLLTIGLVAYGRGYTYNFSSHKVVRTGIVILQSSPTAKVLLDGKKTNKKTTYHESFEAGERTFTLVRDGYHSWTKMLPIFAGEVTLVQYVVLVPNDLKPQTLVTAPPMTAQSLSRDHRHIAYVTGGTDAGVYVYDFGSKQPAKVYTPAAATATAGAEVVSSAVWSDDASHLLVKSQIDGVWVVHVMNANGSNAVNVTTQYNYDFSGLAFSDTNWRQLYWIAPDGLRRLDLDSQSVSGVLATSVKQFNIQGGFVFYVQSTPLGESLWLLDGKGHKPQQLIAALPTSTSYGLSYTNYRGTNMLAVVPSTTQVGTLYSDIFGDNPVAQTVAHDVTDASFSADGHLAAFSGASKVTTYDLEQSTVFGHPVSSTFVTTKLATPPAWFDNFHLLLNQGGRLVWADFDGQNTVDLGAAQATMQAASSADFKSVYVWRPLTADQTTPLVSLQIKQ